MTDELLQVGGLQVSEYSGARELRLQFTIYGVNGHVGLDFDQVKELQTALWWWLRRQVTEAAGYNDPLRGVDVEAIFLAKDERDELAEHRAFRNELRALLGLSGAGGAQLLERVGGLKAVENGDLVTTNRAELERDHRELDALRKFKAERSPSDAPRGARRQTDLKASTSNAYRPGSLAFALQQLSYELQTAAMRASNVE